MLRMGSMLLLAWALGARAAEPGTCTSAEPTPLLHPAKATDVRIHDFQRLPRRMAVETLRLRDGFRTTLLREGCETFAVTFDAGDMPAHANVSALRAIARAYMQRLLRADPDFWIARRFIALQATGTLQGRRLRIEDGNTWFEVGPDDSEPGRLLIVYGASL